MLKKACWLLLLCFPVTSLAGAGVGIGMDHASSQVDSVHMVETHDSGCPHTKAYVVKNSAQHHGSDNPETTAVGADSHGLLMCNQCVLCVTLLIDAAPEVSFVTYSSLTYAPPVQAGKYSFSSLIERPPRV